ncbi:MAG: hypothetical protein R6U94_05815, partial [Nitriliruptoraceae bacterium]
GQTRIDAGDVLILYGRSDQIAELDVRQRGVAGESRHRRAAEHRDVERRRPAEPGTTEEPGT